MKIKNQLTTIFVFAFLFRLILFNIVPVTGDATFHYPIIEYIATQYSIPTFEYISGPNPYWYPPFYHIIGGLVYSLFGFAELTPLIIGLTGVFVFYFFAKKHYPEIAVIATAILSVLPFHSYYSAIGYPDGLLFILAVAAYHFYKNFLVSKSKRDFFYTACFCALSASTHYHGFAPLVAITVHLALKNPKKAVIFGLIAFTLASPWYIRNTYVFGNPFWPKIHGGYFPNDAAVQLMPKTFDGMFGLHKWQALFFDFWIGAPNSGDDISDKIQLAYEITPLAFPLSVFWLIAMISITAIGIMGAKKNDVKLPLIAILICLIPFSGNGLARMFTAYIPFFVLALAKGYVDLNFKWKNILAGILICALIAGPIGYGLGYWNFRQKYIPVFEAIKEGTVNEETLVMPFNVGDCVYYTKRKCLRIGSIGGIPKPSEEDLGYILKMGGVDKVCCTSLAKGQLSISDKLICNAFQNQTPSIQYDSNGVWGKCWDITE